MGVEERIKQQDPTPILDFIQAVAQERLLHPYMLVALCDAAPTKEERLKLTRLLEQTQENLYDS